MPAIDPKFKPQKDINRLRGQIKKLAREKEKMFPVLGEATYGLFLQGAVDQPSISETCMQLRSLDEQMSAAQSEIDRIRQVAEQMKASAGMEAQVSCPRCGSPARFGAPYCGNCGQGLVGAANTPSLACPVCGNPIAGSSRFCAECGTLLETQPAPPAFSQGAEAVSPAPPAPPPAAAAAATTPPPSSTPQGQQAETGKGGPGMARACPQCGAVVDDTNAVFCGECGGRLG